MTPIAPLIAAAVEALDVCRALGSEARLVDGILTRLAPRTWKHVSGVSVDTCSAEDLVIYKLIAARPQDLVDVTSIVQRQGNRLDVERVRHWGREFAELKEDPDLLRPFDDAVRRGSRGP